MTEIPELRRENAMAIMEAGYALPKPDDALIAHATYILSEWLNDSAPLGEGLYRSPAEAVLRFAALYQEKARG